MKKILALTFIFALLFALTSKISSADEKYNITLWHALPDSQATVVADSVAGKLKEKRPELNVTIKRFKTNVELYRALTAPNAETPNLAFIDSAWLPKLESLKKLDAVDEYVPAGVRSVIKMDTYKPAWNACVDSESKLLAVPYMVQNYALLYNKARLNDAGYKAIPTNWHMIADYASNINDGKGASLYIPAKGSDYELARFFQLLANQASGPKYDMAKTGLSGKAAEKTAYYIFDLINVFNVRPTDKKYESAMLIGTVADYLAAQQNGTTYDAIKFAISGSTGSGMDVTSIAIFKKSVKNTNAWDVAYFLWDFPQMTAMTLNQPALPANKQITLSREYFEYLDKNPAVRNFVNLIDKDAPKAAFNNYEENMVKLGAALKEVLNKKAPIDKAAEELTKIVNACGTATNLDSLKPALNKDTYMAEYNSYKKGGKATKASKPAKATVKKATKTPVKAKTVKKAPAKVETPKVAPAKVETPKVAPAEATEKFKVNAIKIVPPTTNGEIKTIQIPKSTNK